MTVLRSKRGTRIRSPPPQLSPRPGQQRTRQLAMTTGASPRPSSLRASERSRKSVGLSRGGYGERGVDPHQSTAVTSPAEAQALAEAVGTKLSGGA